MDIGEDPQIKANVDPDVSSVDPTPSARVQMWLHGPTAKSNLLTA